MPYWNLAVEGGHGRRCGCCCVAVYEHDVGLAGFVEDLSHPFEHAHGNVGEVLPLAHDVEVVVGGDVENIEYLVEHLAVLSGDGDDGAELVGAFLELLYQGRHLYGFRPCAEYEHYGLHLHRDKQVIGVRCKALRRTGGRGLCALCARVGPRNATATRIR